MNGLITPLEYERIIGPPQKIPKYVPAGKPAPWWKEKFVYIYAMVLIFILLFFMLILLLFRQSYKWLTKRD